MYSRLEFFYSHFLTRAVLQFLALPLFSKIAGFFMNRRFSRLFVNGFVKKNGIDLSLYEEKKYRSFNDFFTRKIRPECRPIESDPELLPSPCDGKMTAYRISDSLHVTVKGADYTVSEMIRDEEKAKEYDGGSMAILRLTPDDYHRYLFFDDGKTIFTKRIPGRFHTVNPIIHRYRKVFHENARAVSEYETAHFGNVLMIEVGALFVGKIVNHDIPVFRRGEEKGYFEFGGSTILLLAKKDSVDFLPEAFSAAASGTELPVRAGSSIGRKHLP